MFGACRSAVVGELSRIFNLQALVACIIRDVKLQFFVMPPIIVCGVRQPEPMLGGHSTG
jgi:hypothetical protein